MICIGELEMISIMSLFEERKWDKSETEIMQHLGGITRNGSSQNAKDFANVNLSDFMARKMRAVKNLKLKKALRTGSKKIYNRIDMRR